MYSRLIIIFKGCELYAARGKCDTDPEWMLRFCRIACNYVCSEECNICELCGAEGECVNNAEFMLRHCPKACEICSSTAGKTYSFNNEVKYFSI